MTNAEFAVVGYQHKRKRTPVNAIRIIPVFFIPSSFGMV
jgi:hypothetical protein